MAIIKFKFKYKTFGLFCSCRYLCCCLFFYIYTYVYLNTHASNFIDIVLYQHSSIVINRTTMYNFLWCTNLVHKWYMHAHDFFFFNFFFLFNFILWRTNHNDYYTVRYCVHNTHTHMLIYNVHIIHIYIHIY